ncbi:hypothetical protein, partial [Ilumatobacter sp.]|uniref:hypothetical protein n=1 Tax=Ilumatobacter sp. TaxID=1967498 RepID=UPI003C70578D
MLRELDREWDRLQRRPATIRRVRQWTGDEMFERLVGSVRILDDLVAATQPSVTPSGSGDAILRRLVELAEGDELAGRVVLQRILPGLISRSKRWCGRSSAADPTDIAIGAAWIAIRRFDIVTRRHHIAPALIADALWIGYRRGARRRSATELPVPGSVLSRHVAPSQT